MIPKLASQDGINPSGRLVQEEQLRVVNQSGRQAETTQHPPEIFRASFERCSYNSTKVKASFRRLPRNRPMPYREAAKLSFSHTVKLG
jgi:hypothetical protein